MNKIFFNSTLALLLISPLHGQALTTITQLPFTADIPNETYVLGGDLSLDTGNAITVAADNITLDGNQFTLTYAETGAGHAIFISRNVNRLEIKHFNIAQGNYDPASGETVHAIYRNGNHSGLNIHHNTIAINRSGSVERAYGYGIQLANVANLSSDNAIHHNTFHITGTSAGRGVSVNTSGDGQWSGNIHHNTVTLSNLSNTPAGYPRAIAIGGNGPMDVYNNTIELDAGCDTVQGISLWNSDNHLVHDNTITSYAYQGRAIIIDGDSDGNYIFNNQIAMRSQHTQGDASAGIRLRFASDDNVIFSNHIEAHNGANSFALRVGGREPALPQPRSNIYHSNTLTSASRVIAIEDEGDALFYHNTLNASGGYAIYAYGNADNGAVNQNLQFNFETIRGEIRFNSIGLGSDGVLFCGSGLTDNQVVVGSGSANYTIQPDGCTFVPPSPPGAPTTLLCTGCP